MPYCFQGHPPNFKVTWDQKLPILTWIERFRTVTPVWIHRWIWNDAQSLMYYRRGALLFFKVIHQISSSHGLKNLWFESNLSKITRPVAAIKSLRFALGFFNSFERRYTYQIGAYTITQIQWCHMSIMVFHITGNLIVCSTAYSC